MRRIVGSGGEAAYCGLGAKLRPVDASEGLMLFKNLILYHLPEGWEMAPGSLEERLAKQRLGPIPAASRAARGWVAPVSSGGLVRSSERSMMIALAHDTKLLPGKVIKRVTDERAAAVEKAKGHPIGRKMRREIQEAVTVELLAQAFSQIGVTQAWLDPQSGWMAVNAGAASKAEGVVEMLRNMLDGEFAVSLPEPGIAPVELMTLWLRTGEAPGDFEIGDRCELYGVDEDKPTLRFSRLALKSDEVRRHVELGRRCSLLRLIWRERIEFTLTDRLAIKGLKFVGLRDEASDQADEAFDAEHALFAGEMRQMLDALIGLFKAPLKAAA